MQLNRKIQVKCEIYILLLIVVSENRSTCTVRGELWLNCDCSAKTLVLTVSKASHLENPNFLNSCKKLKPETCYIIISSMNSFMLSIYDWSFKAKYKKYQTKGVMLLPHFLPPHKRRIMLLVCGTILCRVYNFKIYLLPCSTACYKSVQMKQFSGSNLHNSGQKIHKLTTHWYISVSLISSTIFTVSQHHPPDVNWYVIKRPHWKSLLWLSSLTVVC